MTEKDARYWVEKLGLTAHPEGGHYRQTYRAELTIARAALPAGFGGSRPARRPKTRYGPHPASWLICHQAREHLHGHRGSPGSAQYGLSRTEKPPGQEALAYTLQ